MARLKRRKLEQINGRLFADNVEELRRRAAAKSIPWQQLLRTLVDEALKRKPLVVE